MCEPCAKKPRRIRLVLFLGAEYVEYVDVATKALFMTVWRPSTRSAENSCGIRQG